MAASMLWNSVKSLSRIRPSLCRVSRALVPETRSQHTTGIETPTDPQLTEGGKTLALGEGEEPTFESLLRRSKWMQLGEAKGKVVVGTVKHAVDDDLYVDIGHKFYCVCSRPQVDGSFWEYRIGQRVRVKLENLEVAAYFKIGYKAVTALESKGYLLGIVGASQGNDYDITPAMMEELDLFGDLDAQNPDDIPKMSMEKDDDFVNIFQENDNNVIDDLEQKSPDRDKPGGYSENYERDFVEFSESDPFDSDMDLEDLEEYLDKEFDIDDDFMEGLDDRHEDDETIDETDDTTRK